VLQSKKSSYYLILKECNNSLSQNGQVKSFFILSFKVFEDLKISIPQHSHLNIKIVCMRILLPNLNIVNNIDIKKFFYFLGIFINKNK